MKYTGTIVEESLQDNRFINSLEVKNVRITDAEDPSDRWHLYKVEIKESHIELLSKSIQPGAWYMHFWNEENLVVVFANKIFWLKRDDLNTLGKVIDYGRSLGIPESQLDFIIE